MGRNKKVGLDYFPVDTTFFTTYPVRIICGKHGVISKGILIELLALIYRNGYKCDWSEEAQECFAYDIGAIDLLEAIQKIVDECLKRNYFDLDVFKNHTILTSKEIQDQYVKICKDSKRANFEIPKEYNLLTQKSPFPPDEIAFTPEEIVFTPEESTQRKEKKRKENISLEIKMPFKSENFKSLWHDWKEYKMQIHKGRFTTKSEQIALEQIIEFSEGNEDVAVAIIRNAISGGHQGFIRLHNTEFKRLTNDPYKQVMVR